MSVSGVVKAWTEEKGFGFITAAGEDIFVHRTHLVGVRGGKCSEVLATRGGAIQRL